MQIRKIFFSSFQWRLHQHLGFHVGNEHIFFEIISSVWNSTNKNLIVYFHQKWFKQLFKMHCCAFTCEPYDTSIFNKHTSNFLQPLRINYISCIVYGIHCHRLSTRVLRHFTENIRSSTIFGGNEVENQVMNLEVQSVLVEKWSIFRLFEKMNNLLSLNSWKRNYNEKSRSNDFHALPP